MKYALAKQLKDAGYPQTAKYNGMFFDTNGVLYSITDSDAMDRTTGGYNPNTKSEGTTAVRGYTKVPTLSELIGACGKDIGFQLTNHISGWKAYSYLHATTGEGSTPEEAVARLFLALNPPKP